MYIHTAFPKGSLPNCTVQLQVYSLKSKTINHSLWRQLQGIPYIHCMLKTGKLVLIAHSLAYISL